MLLPVFNLIICNVAYNITLITIKAISYLNAVQSYTSSQSDAIKGIDHTTIKYMNAPM